MPITPIPDLPAYTGEAPNRQTQEQAEFSANSDDSLQYQTTLSTNLNLVTAAISTVAGETEGFAGDAEASAVAAAASAGSVVTGDRVHIGTDAGATNQGESSVAMGYYAGNSNQGINSMALGRQAGQTNQGESSVAMGFLSGQTGMGENSVATGRSAGQTDMGDHSVAMGYYAGNSNQGINSVAMGRQAGQTNMPANSIAINSDDSNNTPLATKQIQIGRADYGVKIGDGNVQAVSDRRDKYDITDSPIGLDFINDLTPCFYKYDIRELYEETVEIKDDEDNVISYETIKHKPDGSRAGKRNHAGLIAQDVKTVMDKYGVDFGLFRDESIGAEDAHKDRASDKLALCYIELVPVLIKSVQELSARVVELENK